MKSFEHRHNRHKIFYPFGLGLRGVAANTRPAEATSKEQYNGGSQLEDELAEADAETSTYATPYRRYDPATGRFQGVDPLADKYADVSPYQFAGNDPVNQNDPTGAFIGDGSPYARGHSSFSDLLPGGGATGFQAHGGEGPGGGSLSAGAFALHNTLRNEAWLRNTVGALNNFLARHTSDGTGNGLQVAYDQSRQAYGFYSRFEGVEGTSSGTIKSGVTLASPVVGSHFNALSISENIKDLWNSDIARAFVPDALSFGYAGTIAAPFGGVAGSFNSVLLTRGSDWGFHTTITLANKKGLEFSHGFTGGYASRVNGWSGGLAPVDQITAQSLSGRGAEASGNYILGVTAGVGLSGKGVPTWLEFSGGKAGFGASYGFSNTWVDPFGR